MKPKHLLALGVLVAGLAASLNAAQNRALAQPTEQQKLKERVDALESQLKEANAKADRAAMEKDYIERVQKEAKDYYDKVLITQTWTLTIVGLVLTAVFGLTARFGFSIFDRRIQDSLRDASTQLRSEFNKTLDERFQQLEKANAAQMKKFEGDLTIRSAHEFHFLQGMAFSANKEHTKAVLSFRTALTAYIDGKTRLFDDQAVGVPTLSNLFLSLKGENPSQFEQNAQTELARELYNNLTKELALAALKHQELAPLFRDRNATAPATPAAAPVPVTPADGPDRPTAAPATVPKPPTPAPDNAQPTKAQEPKSKEEPS